MEMCKNCAHREGCLIKGGLVYMLYIQTGRSDELPADPDDINVRPFCNLWTADEKKEEGN